MNLIIADHIIRDLEDKDVLNDEEFITLTEALEYVIQTEKDPQTMLYLGGLYYERRQFDLALEYYNMSASYDYLPAYECLGYIWYYGRTGKKDYKLAYEYFFKAYKVGNLVAEYKIADMYKNGYYVEKDYSRYKDMIEGMQSKVAKLTNLSDPVPEVYTRLARIKKEEGNIDEALNYYFYAIDFLAQRIKYNAFFGNLNMMKWAVQDVYSMIELDLKSMHLFDLYVALTTPCKLCLEYNNHVYDLDAMEEDGEVVILFNGTKYINADDFMSQAKVEGQRLVVVNDQVYVSIRE